MQLSTQVADMLDVRRAPSLGWPRYHPHCAQLLWVRWETINRHHGAVVLPTIKRQRERFLPLPQEAVDILQRRWKMAGSPAHGDLSPSQGSCLA